MTVRVSRTIEFDAPPESIWEFIVDPEQRASAISLVEEYELEGERRATWYIRLPIPVIDSRIAVETEDVERDPPRYVKFVGKSRALRVTGEHTVEPTDDGGSRLVNEFVVDGRIPGVERYFKRNLDEELSNLESALERYLREAA